MTKFKIGDRVRVSKQGVSTHGLAGVVVKLAKPWYIVQLDAETGKGQRGYQENRLEFENTLDQDLKLLSDLFGTCNCLQHGTPKGCASWCNTQPIRKVS